VEEYVDFGRFLEHYKERTGESRTLRSIPNYVYLLLHTLAHHFAHAVVEYSGLESGSLGEYLFPADLAFLVYRRGMTPDLGNLSAMWRNYGRAVLDHLLWDRALKCDSGSLCDQRGGACPACIMAPEVNVPCREQSAQPVRFARGHAARLGSQPSTACGLFPDRKLEVRIQ